MYEEDYPLNEDYLSDIANVKAVNDIKGFLNIYGIKMSKLNTFIDMHEHLRNISVDSQTTPPTSTTEDTTQY